MSKTLVYSEVREMLGLSERQADTLMAEHGRICSVRRMRVISDAKVQELINSGYVRRLIMPISKRRIAEINDLENERYNLTLYLQYIRQNYPQIWSDMIERFSGMGSYSERRLKNG